MKQQRPAVIWAACLLIFFIARMAHAASLMLAWDPDSGNTTGYILSYGTQPGVYTTHIDVGDQAIYDVSGLAPSTMYYFVVQAYNGAGQMSGPSAQVAATTSDE